MATKPKKTPEELAKDKAKLKRDYVTTADGWTAGQWRAKGDTVSLTERQAKYENVALATATAATAKASSAKK